MTNFRPTRALLPAFLLPAFLLDEVPMLNPPWAAGAAPPPPPPAKVDADAPKDEEPPPKENGAAAAGGAGSAAAPKENVPPPPPEAGAPKVNAEGAWLALAPKAVGVAPKAGVAEDPSPPPACGGSWLGASIESEGEFMAIGDSFRMAWGAFTGEENATGAGPEGALKENEVEVDGAIGGRLLADSALAAGAAPNMNGAALLGA